MLFCVYRVFLNIMQQQLQFTYGRSLTTLLNEILKSSRSPSIRANASKALEAIQDLSETEQLKKIKSPSVRKAVRELISK
jgi:hypothetical protein